MVWLTNFVFFFRLGNFLWMCCFHYIYHCHDAIVTLYSDICLQIYSSRALRIASTTSIPLTFFFLLQIHFQYFQTVTFIIRFHVNLIWIRYLFYVNDVFCYKRRIWNKWYKSPLLSVVKGNNVLYILCICSKNSQFLFYDPPSIINPFSKKTCSITIQLQL